MRKAIMLLMIMAIAGTAVAVDDITSVTGPVKDSVTYHYDAPQVILQGGDTILDAVLIGALPFSNAGTTVGFADDYDEVCPYGGSTSPDVVYTFFAPNTAVVDVDLGGSFYDTKVYMYDETLALVACNDDFYSDYTSKIENAPVVAGVQYFIVVDGYGTASGDYVINVTEVTPCFVICDADAVPEGEPTLVDGYVDNFNGGCNSDPEIFQSINWVNDEDTGEAWLCGVGGWYINADGGNSRDLDWFEVVAGGTSLTLTVESEFPMNVVNVILPCDNPDLIGDYEVADCGAPVTLNIVTTPGETYHFFVGSTVFEGPVNEFPYNAVFSGHEWGVVGTEELSWGGVKALFR